MTALSGAQQMMAGVASASPEADSNLVPVAQAPKNFLGSRYAPEWSKQVLPNMKDTLQSIGSATTFRTNMAAPTDRKGIPSANMKRTVGTAISWEDAS